MNVSRGTANSIKAELLWVAKKSLHLGLVHGTAGNFSARLPNGDIVLTPTGRRYEDMTVEDLVIVDFDGNVLDGKWSPTSEMWLHLECLKKYPEIHAVHHCHAKCSSSFAVALEPIPCAVEEAVMYIGGDVPVANYFLTGSRDLAEEASCLLHDRSAVLLAYHGLLTIGKSPEGALQVAETVETTAEIILGALKIRSGFPVLPESTVETLVAAYRRLRHAP